jgi:hypothetical protein
MLNDTSPGNRVQPSCFVRCARPHRLTRAVGHRIAVSTILIESYSKRNLVCSASSYRITPIPRIGRLTLAPSRFWEMSCPSPPYGYAGRSPGT